MEVFEVEQLERAPSSALSGFLSDAQAMVEPSEVAALAVDHLREATGARWAEVVRGNPVTGAMTTLAASDEELAAELQRCRAAAGEPPPPGTPGLPSTVVLDDLSAASPWPEFASVATVRTPVRSAVLTYVPVHEAALVLPVYDDRRAFFTPERRRYAELVARVTGLVLTQLAMSEAMGHLQTAAVNRQQIGTAVGILSARRGVTAEAAFDLLRLVSSRSNRKLRLVAADVVASGDLVDPR